MCRLLYLTFSQLVWMLGVLGFQGDCPYKVCLCAEKVISCESLGLKEIPPLIFSGPSENNLLSFDNNSITTVRAGSFPQGLQEISFMENPITTIEDSAFDPSASTLQRLSFSNARFTRIPDAFLHLSALSDLAISQTYIHDWNVNAMKQIGLTVDNLDLEDVGLTSWPDWIGYFPQLADLTIKTSGISTVPDDALRNQTNVLKTLSLMNNSLGAVPKAVSELTALYMLNLVNTKISNLTYLPHGSKLTSLALDNTSLSDHYHVSSTLRPFASSLLNIYLEGNHLEAIPDLSFLTSLGSITLSNNRISDSKSGAMPLSLYNVDLGYNRLYYIPSIMSKLFSVTSFDLPWNNIKAIRDTDFHTSVMEVDLSSNFIAELTDTSFPVNSSIEILNLNDNPILRISANAFKNLQHLAELHMQNTKLTRVPLALSALSSLKALDVTGSRYLVCTCMEKGVRTVMLGLDEIRGDCGMATLSNFFLNLIQSCRNQ